MQQKLEEKSCPTAKSVSAWMCLGFLLFITVGKYCNKVFYRSVLFSIFLFLYSLLLWNISFAFIEEIQTWIFCGKCINSLIQFLKWLEGSCTRKTSFYSCCQYMLNTIILKCYMFSVLFIRNSHSFSHFPPRTIILSNLIICLSVINRNRPNFCI